MQVNANGQTVMAGAVQYNRPEVHAVRPARLDALDPASTRSAVYVTGVNFGLPVVATVAVSSRHSVFIGNSVCGSVLWESDSLLSCRLVGELVVRGV
jgi:hypothetical protein